jgi:hypothetical protein
MQPKTRILVAFSLALLLSSAFGMSQLALPILQRKARLKLQSWAKSAPLELAFKDVKILWNGFRIVGLDVRRGSDSLRSHVNVTFGLGSSFPFIKPALVTFDRPRILIHRHSEASKALAAGGMQGSMGAQPVTELLDRYFSAGISVRLKRAHVQIIGGQDEVLLDVPELNATLDAKDRTAQIASSNFTFKQTPVLSELSGQILLQKQREFYPFLLEARDPGGQPWALKGQISHDFDSIDFRHKRSGIPGLYRDRLSMIENPNEVRFLLRAKIDGLMSREQIGYNIRLTTDNVFVQHESLGRSALGPWPITVHARGTFIPDTASLLIAQGDLLLSSRSTSLPLTLSFEGVKKNLQAALKADPFLFKFHARTNRCQSILDTVPENVFPLLKDLRLEGEFAVDGELRLVSDTDILKLTPMRNNFNCRVLRSPEILTRQWLFTRSADIPSDLRQNPALIAVKMGSPLPRAMIPDDFFKALVAAEDAKFWRHDGILIESLLAALEHNLKAGHAKFGGSTITMQLAKNLFLDRDKLISRKVQEIALAWVLEQNLSKAEILELYANAVEFAPQTYGIAKAAKVYFGKAVGEMSIAESLFLASILPSPTKNYSESFCRARLTQGLRQRMHSVAQGLSALSQERDFMKTYATDLQGFSFVMNLSGCENPRNRLSQKSSEEGAKRF